MTSEDRTFLLLKYGSVKSIYDEYAICRVNQQDLTHEGMQLLEFIKWHIVETSHNKHLITPERLQRVKL